MRNQLKSNQAGEEATLIGLHSVKNMLGDKRQISLFSEHELNSFSKTYGVKILDNQITDLTNVYLGFMQKNDQ